MSGKVVSHVIVCEQQRSLAPMVHMPIAHACLLNIYFATGKFYFLSIDDDELCYA